MRNSRDEKAVRTASVVIADGSQFARRVTRGMLINLGMRSVAEIGDGLSALEVISSNKPDALILDWDLPDLSGSMLFAKYARRGSDLPLKISSTAS